MSTSSAASRVQTAIIGTGAVGLAVARALSKSGRETVLLERASAIGTGTSSRNSEVIHAGIYYSPPSSYKAQFCVRGKEMMYKFCETHGVGYKNCGKILVATNPEQFENDLPSIIDRASKNGVNDLELLSAEDVKAFEPEVESYGGIYSPSTGIVDSHSFMLALLGDAENAGAILAVNCPVEGGSVVEGDDGGILLQAGGMELLCDEVINCGGLFADKIANMILNGHMDGSDDLSGLGNPNFEHHRRRQYCAKGNYYKLENQKSPFKHLVYPVPTPGGLGVHATIDMSGSTKFGPDVQWIDPNITSPDDIDLTPDPSRVRDFYSEVRKYWPGLEDGNLVPDYSGIRPKLGHPDVPNSGSLKADFCIEGPMDHGVRGFVNLLGIESPGLTSSLAIGEYVRHILDTSDD